MDTDPVVATADLVDFFGVSDQTIANLTAKGVLVRVKRGRYHLRASTRAYVAHLREQAAGHAPSEEDDDPDLARERALLAREQRAGHAMKNAILRGELLPSDDVEAVVAAVRDAAKAKLLALPTKLAPRILGIEDLVEAKDVLTAGVHEALEELSETEVIVADAVDRARRGAGIGGVDEAADAGVETATPADDQPVGG